MTPKEKARELVKKYFFYFPEFRNEKEYDYNEDKAKECALIAVDELIRFEKASINLMNDFMKVVNLGFERKGYYYEEVKQEIEKL
jgi:hypothetical protein